MRPKLSPTTSWWTVCCWYSGSVRPLTKNLNRTTSGLNLVLWHTLRNVQEQFQCKVTIANTTGTISKSLVNNTKLATSAICNYNYRLGTPYRPFDHLFALCDPVTFDLILTGGRDTVMDYPCAKFDYITFSHLGFIMQTDRHTQNHTRRWLLYSCNYRRRE